MNEIENISFEDRVLKIFNDYLTKKIEEIVHKYVVQNCEQYSVAKVISVNELNDYNEVENGTFRQMIDVQLSKTNEIVKNIKNLSTEKLKINDYVVVFSLGMTTQNAYVGLKLEGKLNGSG